MFKYQIENELKDLKPLDINVFRKYIDSLTLDENKIVFFGNTKSEYYAFYCTRCKNWHFASKKYSAKFKKGESFTCGKCNHRFEVIYPKNVIKDIHRYIIKIEVNSRKEVIFRVFYYLKQYDKNYGLFDELFYEVERINYDHAIAMKCNTYCVFYNIYHGPTEKGFTRDRSGFYDCYPYTNVYNRNLKSLLKGTSLQYSAVDIAKKMNLDIFSYLFLWKHNSRLELIAKAGCNHLLSDICIPKSFAINKANEVLNSLDKKGMNLLRKHNLSFNQLQMYVETGVDDISYINKMIRIQFEAKNIKKYKQFYKTIDYLYANLYCERDYSDYFDWCEILGMDMSNRTILYPDNPKKAHDDVHSQMIIMRNKVYNSKIAEFSKELEKYTFKTKSFLIRPAKNQDELVDESKELGHCVRTYASKVAARETSIFFIRERANEDKPFVTLELKNNRVIQCRAYKNLDPDVHVKKFVNDWCLRNHFQSCFRKI